MAGAIAYISRDTDGMAWKKVLTDGLGSIDYRVIDALGNKDELLDLFRAAGIHQVVAELRHGTVTFPTIEAFVEKLSTWYLRRSRRRFWKSESDSDKQAAYSTLYTALVTVAKLLAPATAPGPLAASPPPTSRCR